MSESFVPQNKFYKRFISSTTRNIAESDDIFYPNVVQDSEFNSAVMNDDDALHELFLRQIVEDNQTVKDQENAALLFQVDLDSTPLLESPSLREISSTELIPNVPIEFIYKKKVVFGNFLRSKINSKALQVRLSSGLEVDIDAGQIITVWDIVADEISPETIDDWGRVTTDALQILGNMSPRKSDLKEFYQLISSQRSTSLPVDSLDLAVYIFQEKSFKSWINPYKEASDSRARVPSAAQRYAAALLLFHDTIHFKRKQSELNNDNDSDNDNLELIEGAYKVVSEGQAMFKEGETFADYIESVRKTLSDNGEQGQNDNTEFRAACITRLLRGLELYAMSAKTLSPPAAVKHVLKRFELEISPAGATKLLKSIGKDLSESSVTGIGTISNTGVVPWSSEQLSAAANLHTQASTRREQLAAQRPGKVGRKGPNGRMDYRGSSRVHPVMCIDSKKASFFDDAFSVSPDTGEILIHVVDVAGYLRRHDTLLATAKERVSSVFLPTGPLHMLPPQALDALRLNPELPNDVITVAVKCNSDTGELQSFRVFPSTIGPVYPMTIEDADDILVNDSKEYLGIPAEVVSDLRMTHEVIEKVMEEQSWVGAHLSNLDRKQFSYDKRSGASVMAGVDTEGSANKLVNALLTIYSNATCSFCQSGPARRVSVPVAWENRDRTDSALVRRFASQPLRNWLSMVQQRQLRAAMKMEIPLTKRDCAMAVSHHNSKRKQTSQFVGKGRRQMSFESLEAHCANLLARDEDVVLHAEGIGRGGYVRIKEFGVEGIVKAVLDKGQNVQVRVTRVLPDAKKVDLELIE